MTSSDDLFSYVKEKLLSIEPTDISNSCFLVINGILEYNVISEGKKIEDCKESLLFQISDLYKKENEVIKNIYDSLVNIVCDYILTDEIVPKVSINTFFGKINPKGTILETKDFINGLKPKHFSSFSIDITMLKLGWLPMPIKPNIFRSKKEFETSRYYSRNKNKAILIKILRSDGPISYEMRELIASELEGKRKGRKRDVDRDFSIALDVHRHLKTHPHLRENKKKQGAATIVAEKYNLSEDAIIKIYSQKNEDLDLDESLERGAICFK